MLNIKNILLVGVVVLAATLRLYKLGSVPPHLTPDEASIGYNAYSLLKTGKDEHGLVTPLIFKSFGDYKPGLYIYTVVPSIAMLGVNEFSVRLPSALFGVAAVILVFFLVKEFSDYNNKPGTKLAYLASLLMAINPWHIYFSRGAWEINMSLTLTLLGILFYLRSVKLLSVRYLFAASISFALTLLTYQGAKLSSAIVIFILVIVTFSSLKKFKLKQFVYPVLVGVIISLPVVASFLFGKTGRLNVFSVFSYPRPEAYIQDFIKESGTVKDSLFYNAFYSEELNFFRGISGRFFNHFSGRFLFFEGDWQNPRHSAPNQGMLLLSDMLLVPLGLFFAIRKQNKLLFFAMVWLLLSPLPSILSRDQVHAVRAYQMLVPIVILSAYGLSRLNRLFTGVVFMGVLLSFIYFLDAYFVHLPKHNAKYWEYGYKQSFELVSPYLNTDKRIVVQQSYAQPYIYFLFYSAQKGLSKETVEDYQSQLKLEESLSGDVGLVGKLSNIEYLFVDWSRLRGDKGSIIVADTLKMPPVDSAEGNEFHLIGEVKDPKGDQTIFRVVEIKNQ